MELTEMAKLSEAKAVVLAILSL